MSCVCDGRVGHTRTGSQAPLASTSGRPHFLPARVSLGQRRVRYGLKIHAQVQQEKGREQGRKNSNNSKQQLSHRKARSRGQEHGENSTKEQSSELTQGSSSNWLLAKWEALPSQYKLVFACAWAFVICNMDKVNISVAIITMSRDFNWSPTTSGIVQSSFFAGYMFTQIPGGYVVSKLGGRKVLPTGVSLWSGATAATPLLAGSLPGILLCRVAVGLGEGVAPTSATDMVARVCKQSERSRAIGFIFSGLHVGSLAGLLVAPVLIERLGWPAVFYMFGAVGLLWSGWWESLMANIKREDPDCASRLEANLDEVDESAASTKEDVPWRAILRNTPVRALSYVHFCNNWAAYTMTAWLPSYFSNSLSLDLTQASQAALFPPIAAIAASAVAGPVADHVIAQGAPVASVRKIAQAVAFIGPSIFLGFACKLAGGGADNEMLTVGLISGALGFASVSIAGLYSNHADLSRRRASVLLGITNTMGAIPGIIGVTFTGVVFDRTRDWNWALFAPSIFFWLTGAVVFALYGSADEQAFDDDTPFGFEKYFQPAVRQLAKVPIASVSTSVLSRVQALQQGLKRKL